MTQYIYKFLYTENKVQTELECLSDALHSKGIET